MSTMATSIMIAIAKPGTPWPSSEVVYSVLGLKNPPMCNGAS